MLYAQLTQVLLSRPKRGKMYGAIVGYSTLLFCLATVAMAGSLKFAETIFVDHRTDNGGPENYWETHLTNKTHIMSQVWSVDMPHSQCLHKFILRQV